MKNFDASIQNGVLLHCLFCERQISNDAWFARIKLGNHRVVFCRPWCVEKFLDNPERYAARIEGRQIPQSN